MCAKGKSFKIINQWLLFLLLEDILKGKKNMMIKSESRGQGPLIQKSSKQTFE